MQHNVVFMLLSPAVVFLSRLMELKYSDQTIAQNKDLKVCTHASDKILILCPLPDPVFLLLICAKNKSNLAPFSYLKPVAE